MEIGHISIYNMFRDPKSDQNVTTGTLLTLSDSTLFIGQYSLLYDYFITQHNAPFS